MKDQLQNSYTCFLILIAVILMNGCNREKEFLNAKPNEALAVPSSLSDIQALLHNEGLFNDADPALGEIASDDFYLSDAVFIGEESNTDTKGYIWSDPVYDAGSDVSDWSGPYQQVFYANTALEALGRLSVSSGQKNQSDQIKGTALFFRAIAFYNLVQTFAEPYDSVSSNSLPGIPLRLSSDLAAPSVRASEQQCYEQILQDLLTAVPLLPSSTAFKTQPSQPAANALLARVYLAMGDYSKSFQYADACLKQFPQLTDYNSLTPSSLAISTTFLDEDMFHSVLDEHGITYPNYESITDSVLFSSYEDNDLRKTVFFIQENGLPYFRGTYDPASDAYSGIASDEIYLIRAECNARLGNTTSACDDLNNLLKMRWKAGTYVNFSATSPNDALKKIVTERRKELLYRGLRWTDLRRLNKDSRFAVTLYRHILGITYILPPNDPRYAWPIPDNEIAISHIAQNPR